MADYMNKVYFFAATLGVGFGASIVSRKFFRMSLGLPSTLETAAKAAVVLGACAVGVEYAQEKKWIPKEPFKKAAT